jgi:hypothetical protein
MNRGIGLPLRKALGAKTDFLAPSNFLLLAFKR